MPIMGKTETATLDAIKEIRKELPFKLKGINSDNGSEFINNLLFSYSITIVYNLPEADLIKKTIAPTLMKNLTKVKSKMPQT